MGLSAVNFSTPATNGSASQLAFGSIKPLVATGCEVEICEGSLIFTGGA